MNNRINQIDKKLDIILSKLSMIEYWNFIKSNKYLKKYDYILGRIDIGKLPTFFKIFLTNNLLDEVEKEVDRKLRLINLTEK